MYKDLNYIALGARIRKARETKHLTQEQLGEACLLSASHIGHIERGTRIPSVDTLYRISCVLEVSTDFLLFDSVETDKNLFEHIAALLKGKDETKVKNFLSTVRALADKIDEL
ncbi:MAG: helix-turn-helix domain-containing protein [Acutalibacteraceae bacterium]